MQLTQNLNADQLQAAVKTLTTVGFSFKEDDSGIWSWGWRNMDGKNEFDSFENAAAEAWKEACFFAMEVIFPTMSLEARQDCWSRLPCSTQLELVLQEM